MESIAHRIYRGAGTALCNCCLAWWKIRDRLDPPTSKTILFVAHPDDDALFFHSRIRQEKPYVVLLFTGWSLKRFPDFIKAMKYYGVRCRAYSLVSDGAYENEHTRRKAEKIIEKCIKIGDFHCILTHNAEGEYGHSTHKLVHEVVLKKCAQNQYRIVVPEVKTNIEHYPLDSDTLIEKQYIFENIYKSESWVMTDEPAGTPVWFRHEHLVEIP